MWYAVHYVLFNFVKNRIMLVVVYCIIFTIVFKHSDYIFNGKENLSNNDQ